jgi:transposase InsO family protein
MVAGKLAPGRPRLISEDDRMGITKEELNLRVVVRRMAAGSMPYGWTVYKAHTSAPLHTSADRFRGMEAAYKAGHVWLTDYFSFRQASTSKRRRSRWDDAEALMDNEPQVPGYQLEDRAPEQQRVAPVGLVEF